MKSSVICHFVCLLSIVAAAAFEKQPTKGSYACPPNFIRLSHRCYYFSTEKATWQDAFFQCHSMNSNLAIIRNSNQDKVIKRALSRRTIDPLERWLGGFFDWHRKQWKWAASGKPLSYKGFDKFVSQDEKNLQWSCIVVDPALEYRWNARSCLQEKYYICQKKISPVASNMSRNNLHQQYNTKNLNEIPVPNISSTLVPLKANQRIRYASDPFHVNIYSTAENSQAGVSYKKKKRMDRKKKKNIHSSPISQFSNGTLYENNVSALVAQSDQPYRRRRKKVRQDEENNHNFKMYYTTYKEDGHTHPLHPNTIVEEYNIVKSG
ncbi:uncharacterized protein [Euwallacea similis]|uniref:uncharacterized protein n=1 Tax=Euwallacea similis TaxID=1736056 RepID=UPI00344D6552